jgi:hypothetical protein
MAVSIGVGNKFCAHFRIFFANEKISLDSIMRDPEYAKAMARKAQSEACPADLKAAAAALLFELAGGTTVATTSEFSADQALWDKLGEAARAAAGPIAGALVSKFRKENPTASISDCKQAMIQKFGDKFLKEASSRGL